MLREQILPVPSSLIWCSRVRTEQPSLVAFHHLEHLFSFEFPRLFHCAAIPPPTLRLCLLDKEKRQKVKHRATFP